MTRDPPSLTWPAIADSGVLHPAATERALHMILEERARQDARWGLQRHDPYAWLAILLEEAGEAAEEALAASWARDLESVHAALDRMRQELVQVAAVAAAAVEQLIEEMQK